MEITAEAKVMGALNDFMDAWELRDVEEIMSHFSTSPTLSLYGTGADEKRVGRDEVREQLARDFAQSESLSATLDWNLVGMSDNVAWIASDITIRYKVAGHDEITFPARLSTVVQNYNGRWLFEHFHLSVGAAGQEEGQSF